MGSEKEETEQSKLDKIIEISKKQPGLTEVMEMQRQYDEMMQRYSRVLTTQEPKEFLNTPDSVQ